MPFTFNPLSGKFDFYQAETDPIFSASEAAEFVAGDAAKLAGIEAGAETNNISDTHATDLTDGGATTLHKHDHGEQDGLSDDDHTQYVALAGRAGGQTIKGDTASGGNLILQTTAHATKGKLLIGTSAYDEVNNRLGINHDTPDANFTQKYSGGVTAWSDDLMVNGDFETGVATPWTVTGWAVVNDPVAGWVADRTTTTGDRLFTQPMTITTDKQYMFVYDVVARDGVAFAGQVRSNLAGINRTAPGTYTEYVFGKIQSTIGFRSLNTFTGGIDNVHLYELAPTVSFHKVYDENGDVVVEERGGYNFNGGSYYNGLNAGQFATAAAIVNVGFGSKALENLRTGIYNFAMSPYAMQYTTIGDYNFAMGAFSLRATEGNYNIGLGVNSGSGNVSGSYNLYLGALAGSNQTAGDGNTIIGSYKNAPSLTGSDQLILGTYNYEYLRGIGGLLALGSYTPTAKLHLPAGTATASNAPLKFTSGVLNTAAEAGAAEFVTDDLTLVITTGAARKGIVLDDGTRLTSGKIPVATTNGRLVNLTAQAYEADLKTDYTAGDLDTEAEVITALNATNTKINAIITKLETLGLFATS